jgi:O-antigen/teichoic acid export membrane protein
MPVEQQQPLRRAAIKGGAILGVRQVVSLVLKLVGALMITRVLGPAVYGTYVSASTVYNYAAAVCYAGMGIYFLRLPADVPESSFRTLYSLLMLTGLPVVIVIEASAGWFARYVGIAGVENVARIIALALPFQLLAVPATVRLERNLDYRRVAMNEIVSQSSFYILAVPLVWLHIGGANTLAAAIVVQQVISCLMAHTVTKSVPRFSFDRPLAAKVVRFAVEYSMATWIWQMRVLVNPLIVGPVLGARAVGLVGMTVSLLDTMSVVRMIAWRLSVAILTKVGADARRLRAAVTEGMELQVLAIGAIMVVFGWTGQLIVPRLIGPQWLGLMQIYPYVALSYLTIATFNMHTAALSVVNKNRGLALYNAVSVSIFAITAYLAVPRVGILGYGYAELATIPVYFLLHTVLARIIGSPSYKVAALWWFGAAAGLFWQFGLWTVAVAFSTLLLPISVRKIRSYAQLALTRD